MLVSNLFILHIGLIFAHVFVLQDRNKSNRQPIITAQYTE